MIWIAPSVKYTAAARLKQFDTQGRSLNPGFYVGVIAAAIANADAHTLQRQIQNLRRTRDLLLPRLLSRQVNLFEN
jgi:hypothetical protein